MIVFASGTSSLYIILVSLTPVVHVLSLSSGVVSVANNEDTMVQLIWAVRASIIDEDTVLVEHELALGDIDCNGDWTNCSDSISQSVFVT